MTDSTGLLLITGRQVEAALAGRRRNVTELVRAAYCAHGTQCDALPQASILRFPAQPDNRIIALPAWLDHGVPVAGTKWISSFPANTDIGLERASAVILVNSMRTGRVKAVVEGSVISAQRTAASAALTAAEAHRASASSDLGLIGCGRINFEVLQFMLEVGPAVGSVVLHDRDPDRAAAFADRCADALPGMPMTRAEHVADVLGACSLVSFATTAPAPYVSDLSMCPRGATLLHLSLRDIDPMAVLRSDNLVDDVAHVCTARTSVHLAEQLVGNRGFIRTTIGDVLLGRAAGRADEERPLIFSPFGMGTLDVALAAMVLDTEQTDAAVSVSNFWPEPWQRRKDAVGVPGSREPQ